MPEQRPMLLCDAGYYGTLAAARILGRSGVPVVVVDSQTIAPALWSRHVVRRMHCPPIADVEGFVRWLRDFGARQPGCVLYPTSDELCFLLSLYKDELAKGFALYQPDVAVIERILDKGQLLAYAAAAGIEVPETRLPECEADVERAASGMSGPVMVKPRTQILLDTHSKGALAPTGGRGIVAEYARFIRHNRYGSAVRQRLPSAMRPMLQRYYAEAQGGVYSVTGFRDRRRRHFAVLGAKKVLQRPRSMGVGLCFEHWPVDPALARKVERLIDSVGYYGVFELEFISAQSRWLLIDFNPRFYNQLALDVARGLPLPQLAYAGALDDDAEVARLMAGVPPPGVTRPYAFCNRFSFRVMLGTQRLFGGMSRREVARWCRWRDERAGAMVDAVADPDDPRPYVAEILKQVFEYAKNPRLFWRVHRPRNDASRRPE